jgi:hypothetical protein
LSIDSGGNNLACRGVTKAMRIIAHVVCGVVLLVAGRAAAAAARFLRQYLLDQLLHLRALSLSHTHKNTHTHTHWD